LKDDAAMSLPFSYAVKHLQWSIESHALDKPFKRCEYGISNGVLKVKTETEKHQKEKTSISNGVLKVCSSPLYPLRQLVDMHLQWSIESHWYITYSAVSNTDGISNGVLKALFAMALVPTLCHCISNGVLKAEQPAALTPATRRVAHLQWSIESAETAVDVLAQLLLHRHLQWSIESATGAGAVRRTPACGWHLQWSIERRGT